MAKVCDAVHHAHQRGVIHRDLKPDNILVINPPEGPAPKALDFGIARLDSPANPAQTMNTRPGQLIGTLAFMSPEQVGGCAEDIDTRTDIYALGLIMYRVLAGRSAHNLDSLSLPSAVRTIADVDPPRLASTRPELRGDIDTIVHKAIARDKADRYPSASELAADIRRHLTDEPITARPATAWQSVRRFTRRNRAVVALQANRAAKEAAIARAVSNTLKDAFLIAAPSSARGKDPTLREALDLTTQRLEEPFDGPPEAEATVRNVIGIVQRNFGEFDKARPQFERALEIRRRIFPAGSEEIADSLHNLALLLSVSGKPLKAIPLMREALDTQRKTLGPDHPNVARSLYNLSRATLRAGQMADALTLTNESLALHRRIAPVNHEAIGMHLIQLASIESARFDHTAAERYALESVAILREHLPPNAPPLATVLNELARVRLAAGSAEGAVEPSRESFDIASAVFASNADHPLVKSAASTRTSVQRVLESRTPDPATSPSMSSPR